MKVSKRCSMEDVDAAILAAAGGPMMGIINFETQTPVSSGFMGTDSSSSAGAALTTTMCEDLVEVVMWNDNEWGYSQ